MFLKKSLVWRSTVDGDMSCYITSLCLASAIAESGVASAGLSGTPVAGHLPAAAPCARHTSSQRINDAVGAIAGAGRSAATDRSNWVTMSWRSGTTSQMCCRDAPHKLAWAAYVTAAARDEAAGCKTLLVVVAARDYLRDCRLACAR
jgi:hypothetical protein